MYSRTTLLIINLSGYALAAGMLHHDKSEFPLNRKQLMTYLTGKGNDMEQQKQVMSITFLVYDNAELKTKHRDDVTAYNIPLINMSIDDALSLKDAVMRIPNVGGVININLNNGNVL